MVAIKKRKRLPNGRVIKFKTIESFLRTNNGVKAVAYQNGGTYSVLARNGNCTTFFNSDPQSMRQFLGGAKPIFVPVR